MRRTSLFPRLLRRASWFAGSFAVHGVLVIVLAIVAVTAFDERDVVEVKLAQEIDMPLASDGVVEPEAVEIAGPRASDPTLKDAPVGDFEEMESDDDAPFEGPATNAVIGIGGGAGGAFRGRGRPRRLRAGGAAAARPRASPSFASRCRTRRRAGRTSRTTRPTATSSSSTMA